MKLKSMFLITNGLLLATLNSWANQTDQETTIKTTCFDIEGVVAKLQNPTEGSSNDHVSDVSADNEANACQSTIKVKFKTSDEESTWKLSFHYDFYYNQQVIGSCQFISDYAFYSLENQLHCQSQPDYLIQKKAFPADGATFELQIIPVN